MLPSFPLCPLRAIHPYDVPEIISFPIDDGSQHYLKWMAEAVTDIWLLSVPQCVLWELSVQKHTGIDGAQAQILRSMETLNLTEEREMNVHQYEDHGVHLVDEFVWKEICLMWL